MMRVTRSKTSAQTSQKLFGSGYYYRLQLQYATSKPGSLSRHMKDHALM